MIPYLRQKVERMFLVAREEVADSQAGKYQKIFVRLFPFLHLLLDSLDICNILVFLHFTQTNTSLSGFLLRFSLSEEGKHHNLLSYLIGKKKIHIFFLLKIKIIAYSGFHLVSLTPERMREKSRKIYQNENSKKNICAHFFKTKLFLDSGGLSYFLSSSVSKFGRLLTFCLEFGSFFLQFLGRSL